MNPTKPSRKEQKQETQKRILDAALQEFSEKGYDGSNIRAIAARAKVNHGLIKHYFDGKENLWKKAVEFMFQRARHEVIFDENLEPAQGFKSYIRSYTQYCAKHPEHARIMIQASMHSVDRLRWTVESQLLPNKEKLLRNIEKQKKAGLWPDISSVSIIYIIVSACQLIFALGKEAELLYQTNVYDEQFIDSHAEAIISLLTQQHLAPNDT